GLALYLVADLLLGGGGVLLAEKLFNLPGNSMLLRLFPALPEVYGSGIAVEFEDRLLKVSSIPLEGPYGPVSVPPLHENSCIHSSQDGRGAEERVSAGPLILAPMMDRHDVRPGFASER